MANYEATKYNFDGSDLTGIEGTATGTILPWSAASLPTQISLGLTAASTVSQFAQSRNAATAARQEGEFAAKQENLAAVQREADRKERLARAMASQTASAGSRGVAVFEGSPLSVLQEDVRREEEATERDISVQN